MKKLLGFSRIHSDMVEWATRRGRGAKAIGKQMDGKKMNKEVAPLETVEIPINPDKQNRDLSAFGELGTSLTRQLTGSWSG